MKLQLLLWFKKKKKIAFALILWIGFAYGNKYFGKKKEIRLKEYENA